MQLSKNLKKNIIVLLFALNAFQCLIILITHLIFKTPYSLFIIFLSLCPLVHIFLFIGLISLKELFVYSDTGTIMQTVNISNILSLFRVSSSPTLLFLYLSAKYSKIDLTVPIIIFTAIVFLSDLFDGYLARKFKEITNIGKYLDSSSDYIIILIATIVFLRYGLLDPYFLIMLLIRLSVVAVGNFIIFLKYGWVPYRTSFLGKASVFAVMLYFAINILNLSEKLGNDINFFGHSVEGLINIIKHMVSGVLVITIIEKVNVAILMFRELENKKDQKETASSPEYSLKKE